MVEPDRRGCERHPALKTADSTSYGSDEMGASWLWMWLWLIMALANSFSICIIWDLRAERALWAASLGMFMADMQARRPVSPRYFDVVLFQYFGIMVI